MEGRDVGLQDPLFHRAETAELVPLPQAPILVAVDLSSEAAAAITWACTYADSTGAPLEILHVIHDPGDSPGAYKPDGKDLLEPIADVANRKLDRFVESVERDNPHLQGLSDATAHCIEGLPAPTIVDIARARRARLVVLGGRRRNGLARLVHGSTAQQVVERAGIAVTIVKSGDG